MNGYFTQRRSMAKVDEHEDMTLNAIDEPILLRLMQQGNQRPR